MAKLNDIILTIKNEEDKEDSIENNNNKIYLTLEEELKNWILILKEKLFKRNYKRVIKYIVTSHLINKFKKCKGGYKIIILYIESKLKVIENKIFKYNLNKNGNIKQKYQINHCFFYANNIQEELNLLLQEISNNDLYDNIYYYDIKKRNYKIELFDDIIRCHFDYIYTMSLLHYKIGNLMESISYLSLFLKLYKEANPYILSTHTLYKIEKCFILLSNIYILNEDYENALKFLNESIKIAFKQIIFQVHEIYYGVFVGDKKDLIIREKEDLLILKDSKIKRIILNIVIIFLYQGICNEHLSNIKKATAFYKQCEWFSRIFLANNNKIIYKLFYKLKKSSIEVCNYIDFFKEKIEEYEMRKKQKKEEAFYNIKNKNYKLKKEKLYDTVKFKGLIKKLEGLKIQEIDTVNKFENSKTIKCLSSQRREGKDKNLFLSNIRLLEAYLGNDFKNIVNDMDKIKIFDLDYRTKTTVQKALNKIYFDKNQSFIRNKNKNAIYKPHQKNIIIRNYINDESEKYKKKSNNNKFLSKYNYKIFDFSSYLKKRYNNKSNINLSKLNLTKSNSLKHLSHLKEKINIYNKRNKLKSKIFKRNRETIDSPKIQKINNSLSSSFIFNSTLQYNINKEYKTKPLELKNGIEKEIKKNKSTSLKRKLKSSKYKLILPENQRLNDFFNFKYLKKRNFIKKLEDRDLLFQKSILKSKRTPRLSLKIFNKSIVKQNAYNFFNKIEAIASNALGNNDWKDIFSSEEEYKEYLINNRLEKALFNSLDNKALINYKKNKKRREKEEEEEKEIIEDSFKYDKKFVNIDNNNKNILDNLNQKLIKIYEKELKRKNENIKFKCEIKKQIYNKLYRNKSVLNCLPIKDNLDKKLIASKSYENLQKKYK